MFEKKCKNILTSELVYDIFYNTTQGGMFMYKAYKFRLYPNDEQKILIHKTFGCVRFVYNHFLRDCMENGYKKSYDMCKELKELQ